jgi:multidrug efflux pump subunit AcrA (membrane-fusion protein)
LIVPASEFGHLRKGMRLAVRLGQPVNAVYDAEVVIVDPVIDAASGTFGVRALLPNPDLRLPAGLSCTAEITGGEDKQAQAGLEGAAPDGAGIP